MNLYFYFFISILGLFSITFDELSEKHQRGWEIYNDDLDSAEILFQESLEEYQGYLDVRRETVALMDLARVYKRRGDFVKSLRYLLRSEKMIGQFEDSVIASTLYNRLYSAYGNMNNVEKSLEYLKKQRAFLSENDSLAIFGHYLNLADLYIKMEKYDLGKENLDIANNFISLADKNKKLIFNKYGYYFYRIQQPDSSIKYFEKSMKYYDAWENKIDLSSLLNYLSMKQELKGNVTIKTLDSVARIIEKHDLDSDRSQLLALKANVLQDTSYLHKAIELSMKENNLDFRIDLIKEMAELQYKLKYFDAHKSTIELYHKLKDSVTNVKNQNLLKDLSLELEDISEVSPKSNLSFQDIFLYITLVVVFLLAAYIIYTKFTSKRNPR